MSTKNKRIQDLPFRELVLGSIVAFVLSGGAYVAGLPTGIAVGVGIGIATVLTATLRKSDVFG